MSPDEWLIVGEIVQEEADKIAGGATPYRIDEILLQYFRPLYNNSLMTVRHGGRYFLEVHSNLKPERKI